MSGGMGGRLKGGYWKIWHNSKMRLAGALLVAGGLMWSSYGPLNNRPQPCDRTPDGYQLLEVEAAARAVIASARTESERAELQARMADYRTLSPHCLGKGRPNLRYATDVGSWTYGVTQSVWGEGLPYLLLFLGILLSVGPPFSGESNESFALTFSLPWSRERWLWTKVAFSVAMLAAVTMLVFVVGILSTQFPYMDQMQSATSWYRGEMAAVAAPHGIEVLRAMVAGMVGIAIGMWASMLTRNALAAAVGASLAAFTLVALDLGDIIPSRLYQGAVLLDLENAGGMIAGITIICGSALLAMVRLQKIDF